MPAPRHSMFGQRVLDSKTWLLLASVLVALLAAAGVRVAGPVLVLLVPLWGFVIAYRRPGWFVAYAISGFFAYLGVLQLGGEEPRTLTTAAYYAAVASALLLTAWRGRGVLLGRMGSGSRLLILWVASAGTLALWFGVNVALLSRNESALRFLALLVLLTVPTVLAALGFGSTEFHELREGLILLGFALVLFEAVAIVRGPDLEGGRLEAIAELDAISTSLVPALGAISLLALPAFQVGPWLQIIGGATLICGCLVAGTRGAAISLALTLVVLILFCGRRVAVVALVAGVVGLVAGVFASQLIGTTTLAAVTEVVGIELNDEADEPKGEKGEKGEAEPGGPSPGGAPGQSKGGNETLAPAPPPISSLRMRREWFRQSFEEFPDSPLVGHGVAQLENRTADARRLGTYGERIWPHNDLAEAAFSLGLLGLVPFLLLIAVPIYALARMKHIQSDALRLLCGLFTFAFVQSNFSGEIGADALLWFSGASVAAVYADWRWGRRQDVDPDT